MRKKLSSLQICGNILTTKDYNYFALRCAKCENIFGQWPTFLTHLKENHSGDADERDEPLGDDELSLKDEDNVKEQNDNISIKQDDDNDERDDDKSIEHNDDDFMQNDNDQDFKCEVKEEVDELDLPVDFSLIQVGGPDNLEEDEFISLDGEADGSDKSFKVDSTECSSDEDENADNKSTQDENKFVFNLEDEKHRRSSLHLLRLLKKHPILYDSSHTDYRKPYHVTKALQDIKLALSKNGGVVSCNELQNCVVGVLKNFKQVKQEIDDCGSLDKSRMDFFNKCAFLDVHINEYTRVEPVRLDSEDDGEEDEEKDMPNNKISHNGRIINCTVQGRPLKRMRFHIVPNEIVTELINLLREAPVLWDKNRKDYNNRNDREELLQQWQEAFKTRHDINFSREELSLNLQYLHRYHQMSLRRKDNNTAVKSFLEQCSFLPIRNRLKKKCDHCDSFFLNMDNYKAHLYTEHNIGDCPFKCAECGKIFKTLSQLQSHNLNIHIKDMKFACDQCERRFLRRSDLVAHMPMHTGQNRYICATCGKSFRRKTNLIYHEIRIHLRQRNFNCNMCPKAFYTKALLRDHINSHLNIRKHKCPTCEKAFHSSHSLMRHKQIHLPVKKYKCKLCDAPFSQFVGLNSHMKTRHRYVNNADEAPKPSIDPLPEMIVEENQHPVNILDNKESTQIEIKDVGYTITFQKI